MGRTVRQKRKNRSKAPKIKQKKKSTKLVIPNAEIAAKWNSKETMSQNYRRLGLATKLNQISGGTEKRKSAIDGSQPTSDSLIISSTLPSALAPSSARVERDPNTGKILRIVDDETPRRPNPLNDPLNDVEDMDLDDTDNEKPTTELVQQLKEQASKGGQKAKRKQSAREVEWIEALVEKYGDDYKKMFWDKILNPMQQSEGDIKRRISQWRQNQGSR
ncbi:MAG: Nucleolar protein 16 [Bogoriella megaspora]|nr:MAG: Nucleolar protein 16 [Bogoriella megaspora]